MPFANLSTLYLNGATNASAVGWGTNVRKLGATSDAVSDQTTTTNHGTGAAVSVTVSPFAASSTTGSQPNFGFAVLPSDMGGATGARRFYRAGNHTLVCGAASSAAVTAADAQLVLKAYRVQIASSYSRTLLESATGPLFNLGAVPNTFLAVSVMLALPEIILEPGRSLVGGSGVLASDVILISRKSSTDLTRWVYTDVGLFQGLIETLGEAIKYPVYTPKMETSTSEGTVVLAGPTCDSTDIMYEEAGYQLPEELEIGDKIFWLTTGAYTNSYSSIEFTGFPPLEVVYVD